jgi:hypothetical protein
MWQIKLGVQKKLELNNLSEIYAEFKESHPGLKVQFPKSASLLPKNCVLAEASRTHSVCVHTAHQNVKLMLEGCKMAKLMTNLNTQLSTYHHCLGMMMYNPAQQCCCFQVCTECPGSDKLQNLLENRSLETIVKPSDEFIDMLIAKLAVLQPHSGIAGGEGGMVRLPQAAQSKGWQNGRQNEEYFK